MVAAAVVLALAASATPALARHHHHRHAAPLAPAAGADHGAIPQNTNIEHLNALSLQRAQTGQETSRPLAPPLNR